MRLKVSCKWRCWLLIAVLGPRRASGQSHGASVLNSLEPQRVENENARVRTSLRIIDYLFKLNNTARIDAGESAVSCCLSLREMSYRSFLEVSSLPVLLVSSRNDVLEISHVRLVDVTGRWSARASLVNGSGGSLPKVMTMLRDTHAAGD